jgi:hypothetical protein
MTFVLLVAAERRIRSFTVSEASGVTSLRVPRMAFDERRRSDEPWPSPAPHEDCGAGAYHGCQRPTARISRQTLRLILRSPADFGRSLSSLMQKRWKRTDSMTETTSLSGSRA